MPFDDVFELTGLFLLDVRRQEDSGSSQAVVLEVQKHSATIINNLFIKASRAVLIKAIKFI